MFAYVLLIFVVLFLVCVNWWTKLIYNDIKFGHLPRPFAVPIVGNTWAFLPGGTSAIIPVMKNYMFTLGTTFRMMMGFDHYLISGDPKFIESILSSTQQITKTNNYEFLSSWLGNGLLKSTGNYWKRQRRIITPAFHLQILEQFLDVFDQNSNILIKRLQCELEVPSIDIYPYVTNCALDIICESAMGVSVNAQEHSDSEYVHAVTDMCRIVVERTISPVQQFDLSYQFTSNFRAEKKNVEVLHSFTNKVIKDRRSLLLKTTDTCECIGGFNQLYHGAGVKKRFAFLDALLQARTPEGDALTNDEIRQEVDTFLFAGHDTSASAISFCLYALAQNSEIQDKVVQELQQIFNRNQDQSAGGVESRMQSASYRDLQNMKYLDMVIKESLRMYPSVPAIGRILTSDFELDGHTYPAGLQMLLLIIGLHNNPEFFPNPDKFDPERFNEASKSALHYVPFSAGARNCIGQKFANLELKAVLSKLLRRYEFLPANPKREPVLLFEATLKSGNGIHVQLKSRNW